MPVTSRRVAAMESALKKKGFQRDNTHHYMYWLFADGKKTSVHTFFSHGESKYEKGLLAKVKKQICLDDWSEFDRFMDCPMSGAEYLKLMKARGKVKGPVPEPPEDDKGDQTKKK